MEYHDGLHEMAIDEEKGCGNPTLFIERKLHCLRKKSLEDSIANRNAWGDEGARRLNTVLNGLSREMKSASTCR